MARVCSDGKYLSYKLSMHSSVHCLGSLLLSVRTLISLFECWPGFSSVIQPCWVWCRCLGIWNTMGKILLPFVHLNGNSPPTLVDVLSLRDSLWFHYPVLPMQNTYTQSPCNTSCYNATITSAWFCSKADAENCLTILDTESKLRWFR